MFTNSQYNRVLSVPLFNIRPARGVFDTVSSNTELSDIAFLQLTYSDVPSESIGNQK